MAELAPARFTALRRAAGGYESFYLRAVDPRAPRSVWLRHTVHKPPGSAPAGAIWLTLFDAEEGPPVTLKQSSPDLRVPGDGWIAVAGSAFGPGGVRGTAEHDGRAAAYDIAWGEAEEPLRHLPADWMYRAPLPRTKLESPHPRATFGGRLEIDGRTLEIDGWTGMVGHNWGAEHAERWIWLHGTVFDDLPGAWLDLALGRVRIAGRTTPWVANGVVSVGGRRTRMGGLLRPPREVRESPLRLTLDLRGEGARLSGDARSARDHTVVWRYADPEGPEHHVANCSLAALDLVLARDGQVPLRMRSGWGGAYELGMREPADGLPVQPHPDP